MFFHIFINRFKCLVRDRQNLFWTFLFPLVLATFFNMAFSNLSSTDNFSAIPIAVVNNAEYTKNDGFHTALESVTANGPDASQHLFTVDYLTEQSAEEKLNNNKIAGYIVFHDGPHIVVNNSGFGQTVLKQFVDSYMQSASAYMTIVKSNPAAAAGFKFEDNNSYIKSVAPGKAAPNNTLTYYYALIAMASLFGGFWGLKEVSDIQADLSPQGARLNMVPVHKLKIFGSSFIAAIIVHFMSLILLVAYLVFVLKIDFSGQIGYVLLTCLVGSVTGVTFGSMLSAFIKNNHLKASVLIAASLSLSFLSGLMIMNVKFVVTHAVPLLSYINPACLISDAFYSLYYYSTYTKFFLCIGLLLAWSAVYYLIVYFVMRRSKYASI